MHLLGLALTLLFHLVLGCLQIREAQAIHMLQHRYTPSEVYEFVDMALETRPELGATTHAELTDWHEQQWAQLKAAMEGGEEHN
jgi:hypothetical protein